MGILYQRYLQGTFKVPCKRKILVYPLWIHVSTKGTLRRVLVPESISDRFTSAITQDGIIRCCDRSSQALVSLNVQILVQYTVLGFANMIGNNPDSEICHAFNILYPSKGTVLALYVAVVVEAFSTPPGVTSKPLSPHAFILLPCSIIVELQKSLQSPRTCAHCTVATLSPFTSA